MFPPMQCGIVAYLGTEQARAILLSGLARLEYRGYDSAGVATISDGHIGRCRAQGKLVNLEERLKKMPLAGKSGIGHTRWATGASATERSARRVLTSATISSLSARTIAGRAAPCTAEWPPRWQLAT